MMSLSKSQIQEPTPAAGVGSVFLVPVEIAAGTGLAQLPIATIQAIQQCHHWLVEEERTARRFISSLKLGIKIPELQLSLIPKANDRASIKALLKPALQGHHIGVMSEAGSPAIADPGAAIAAMAHEMNLTVVPCVGPSSFVLALMASGLGGQSFAFHGYLPIQQQARERAIKDLEASSRRLNQTQIIMETPYRNRLMWQSLLNTLHANTSLCLAIGLHGPDSAIVTKSVAEWRNTPILLDKRPAVFLFRAEKGN